MWVHLPPLLWPRSSLSARSHVRVHRLAHRRLYDRSFTSRATGNKVGCGTTDCHHVRKTCARRVVRGVSETAFESLTRRHRYTVRRINRIFYLSSVIASIMHSARVFFFFFLVELFSIGRTSFAWPCKFGAIFAFNLAALSFFRYSSMGMFYRKYSRVKYLKDFLFSFFNEKCEFFSKRKEPRLYSRTVRSNTHACNCSSSITNRRRRRMDR